MADDNDRTYSKMKMMEIKELLSKLNPEMANISPIEVMNLSLLFFGLVCNNHVEKDEKRQRALEGMVLNRKFFINNVGQLLKNTYEVNDLLNDYLEGRF